MKLKDMLAMGRALEEEYGGDVEVVLRDEGATDASAVVRLESITATTATIFDLGNGVAALTLDDDRPGTQVPVIVLD